MGCARRAMRRWAPVEWTTMLDDYVRYEASDSPLLATARNREASVVFAAVVASRDRAGHGCWQRCARAPPRHVVTMIRRRSHEANRRSVLSCGTPCCSLNLARKHVASIGNYASIFWIIDFVAGVLSQSVRTCDSNFAFDISFGWSKIINY